MRYNAHGCPYGVFTCPLNNKQPVDFTTISTQETPPERVSTLKICIFKEPAFKVLSIYTHLFILSHEKALGPLSIITNWVLAPVGPYFVLLLTLISFLTSCSLFV